jgi:hypothetical protein
LVLLFEEQKLSLHGFAFGDQRLLAALELGVLVLDLNLEAGDLAAHLLDVALEAALEGGGALGLLPLRVQLLGQLPVVALHLLLLAPVLLRQLLQGVLQLLDLLLVLAAPLGVLVGQIALVAFVGLDNLMELLLVRLGLAEHIGRRVP